MPPDTAIDRALCAIARALYRMDETGLRQAEADLERLLDLARHYRQLARGQGADPDAGTAHLQVGTHLR